MNNTQSSDIAPALAMAPDLSEAYLKLKQALNKHSLLKISITGYTNKFSSALLAIDQEQKYIIIDEPFPKIDSDLILRNKVEFMLQCVFNGANMFFSTTLLKVGDENGQPYYVMSFPENIQYDQKRSCFRLQVSQYQKLPVRVLSRTHGLLEGYIDDISASGMSIALNTRKAFALTNDKKTLECHVDFPDHALTCSVDPCYIQQGCQENQYLMGCQFKELSAAQETKLLRSLARMERQMVRDQLRYRALLRHLNRSFSGLSLPEQE